MLVASPFPSSSLFAEEIASAEVVNEAVVIEGAAERLGIPEGAPETEGVLVSVGESDGGLDSEGAALEDGTDDGPVEGDRDELG